MPDLGVVVTLVVTLWIADDAPPVRYQEQMRAAACIGAVAEIILTELQAKGSIKLGGTIQAACQLDMPDAQEH